MNTEMKTDFIREFIFGKLQPINDPGCHSPDWLRAEIAGVVYPMRSLLFTEVPAQTNHQVPGFARPFVYIIIGTRPVNRIRYIIQKS